MYCAGMPIISQVFQEVILPNVTSIGSVAFGLCAAGYMNGPLGQPKFVCTANSSTSGLWNATGECLRAIMQYLIVQCEIGIINQKYFHLYICSKSELLLDALSKCEQHSHSSK